MRPLGYVLIAFNLLAAGGFVYLGLQDWKGRQETNGAVLRHIVMLRGMPFEGKDDATADPDGGVDFKMEMTAGNLVTSVPPSFLTDYYKDAPAGDGKSIFAATTPVPSQMGELKRVRAKVKEAFDAATTPAVKTRLLQAWLDLGVESYTERVLIQKAVEKGDWGTLSLYLDMRFQQVSPKLLEGASAPLASDQWEKLPGRIEKLEADLKAAEGELNSALVEVKKIEASLKKPQADQLAAQAKLTEAERLLERAKREQDVKLEALALKDIEAFTPAVRAASDAVRPLLFISAEKIRVADEKQRVVDALATELSMLRRPAVPDEDGRRTRLAHLLVHLDPDAAWQKRVMLVVGLRRYVPVIAAQASRFDRMAKDVDNRIRRDQEEYSSAIANNREIALARTRLLKERADERKQQEEQRDRAKTFVEQRRTQLAELETTLAKIKADVAAMLAEQTSLEQELFILQREIAVTLEEVYALQDELREAEKARFSLPKP